MLKKIYNLNAISTDGGSVLVNVSIEKKAKMLVAPDATMVEVSRLKKVHNAIDFDLYITKYKFENQTYLGTVKSITSDAMMDIYFIKVDEDITSLVSDPNDMSKLINETKTVTEVFFLIIPSLLYLPDSDSGTVPEVINLDGAVFGVHSSNGVATDIGVIDVANDGDTKSYLPTDLVVDAPTSLRIYPICLDGVNTDSKFNSIEIYVDGGQINSDSGMPTQIIELGEFTDLFSTYLASNSITNLELEISRIGSRAFGKYNFTRDYLAKMQGGKLALSVNF